MTSNTILVPLDGSPESNAALPLARALARATSASIVLLRVIPHDDPETTRIVCEELQKLASEQAGSGLCVASAVRHGHTPDEILAEIRRGPASMVVMRTHGRAGIERAILGSVADKVLAHSPVPVVLMRPDERATTGVHTLLVPLDGSPGGAAALETGVALARDTGACIELVQVILPIAMQGLVPYDYSGGSYYDPALDDEALASATKYIDGLVGRLRSDGLDVHGEALAAASAAQGIVDAAETRCADLVVMSTRALTGPARTLLGSVANAVVRTAHCPILLVHRGDDSKVGPASI